MMYRYYKGAVKKEIWRSVEIGEEAKALSDPAVQFATVLAVSEQKPPGVSVSADALYTGPFYIDIDSEEITKSIRAAKGVIRILTDSGVPLNSISIWASGKKGFHLSIPMACVTDEVPTHRLGSIYKQMVLLFRLNQFPEVDLRVYSLSKGRMWRLPNRMREDNNKFKVPLLIYDLNVMNPKLYAELTSKPREIDVPVIKARVQVLETFFNVAQQKDRDVVKQAPVFIDPILHEALQGELPPCAQNLLGWENIKPTAGFNNLSLQFAKAVAAFSPSTAEELISAFADTAKGENYNTPAKRKSHCMSAYILASKNRAYDWNCHSALSVLNKEPCENCPISFIRFQGEQTEEPEFQAEAEKPPEPEPAMTKPTEPGLGIQAKKKRKVELTEIPANNQQQLIQFPDGYGFTGRSGVRPISNFVLTARSIYMEYIANQERDVRVAAKFDVWIGTKNVGQMILEEGDWTKSKLISSLAGLGNAAYYGTDDDVQKLKAVIMDQIEANSDHLSRVYSVGVQRRKVADEWVFTWVEPGWSIDQHGMEDLSILSGKVPAYPRLKSTQDMEKGDATVSAVLSAMMKVNDPQRVAQVLGWTMACFLKTHIFTFRNEFPLLSLHGEPGSGKTSTASLFAALHGVDYKIDSSPINIPASTPFVVWSFVASSTTVPRCLEEFNKSKLGAKYELYAENLKACWNQHSVQRGTLAGKGAHGNSQIGAHVVDIPLTGPVVICSEQEITMVSLVERTIQVRFSQRDKERQDFMDAYNFAANNTDSLKPFARAAYFEALKLDIKTMRKWLDDANKCVPQEITGRPRYSYQVVLAGLSFLFHIVKVYNLPVQQELYKLRENFLSWLSANRKVIATGKKHSEVDAIIIKWNTMAAIASTSSNSALMANEHYLVKDGILYVDTIVAHTLYMKFIASERGIAVIDNVREFNALIKGEHYCVSIGEAVPGFARGRPALALNLAKLADKGISTSGFEQ